MNISMKFLTVGLMVSMSHIGKQGSSRAIAVVENQTEPVATRT